MSEKDQERKIPTKDEILALIAEQTEVLTAQVGLQTLKAQLAKAQAEELQALNFIAGFKNPQEQGVPHTVTQEDMDNHPELAEEGVEVGDEIMIPAPQDFPKKDRKLKKA